MSKKPSHDYHLVDPSPWPLVGAFSTLTMFVGAVLFIHEVHIGAVSIGSILLPLGFVMVVFTMYVWWKDVIHEGLKGGFHTTIVRHGLRIGMALFILSEVMFFFGFFWSFFKSALIPMLEFSGDHVLDGEAIVSTWPPKGIVPFDAWDLPFINTLVLLLSGTTVTWAHYGLLKKNQGALVWGLFATVCLGVLFTCLQALEYSHAPFSFNQGIYPSNFFMATGFHGAHVIIGTVFLT